MLSKIGRISKCLQRRESAWHGRHLQRVNLGKIIEFIDFIFLLSNRLFLGKNQDSEILTFARNYHCKKYW